MYKLTKKGRSMLYAEWQAIGGSGVSHQCTLRHIDNWFLGEIEDAFSAEGRSFARWAYEELGRHDLAEKL